MVTTRYISQDDYELLKASLAADIYHSETPPEFFYEEGTVCSIYSDEKGPVFFARGQPVVNESGDIYIKLDLQYLNNLDARRNMRTLLDGFKELEIKAAKNGFKGFITNVTVPALRKFDIRRLGFRELNEEFLIKDIQELPTLDKSNEDKV
jgi:hypothetical protein